MVPSNRMRLNWSAGPSAVLQQSPFGSGCILQLQWVDAMPVIPEQAQDQPSPTLKDCEVVSVLSYRHIEVKCLAYTSPASAVTALLNRE